MTTRLALCLRRVMLRTSRSPLRVLWRLAHAVLIRAVVFHLTRGLDRASVHLTGSFAEGDPVYGLSDIDLVVTVHDARHHRAVERRWEAVCRWMPALRGLFPHLWVYEAQELRRSVSAPYLIYGLDDGAGRAAFLGERPLADFMGLQERPGLYGPMADWRRVAGPVQPAPPPVGDRQRQRIAAWLELQYRWRWVFAVCLEPDTHHAASHCVNLIAGPARVWLWLAHGERVRGRRATLERTLSRLPDERDTVSKALALHDRLHRSPKMAVEELLPSAVATSSRIATLIESELRNHEKTPVRLLGGPDRLAGKLPLADWRARTVPRVDSSAAGLRLVPDECFRLLDRDPLDAGKLLAAVGAAHDGLLPVMRTGDLLVQATAEGWGAGRMRGVQCPASDPVSFALIERRSQAHFPDVAGWSARDCARRAVAEHRAWLRGSQPRGGSGPAWVGIHPDSRTASPAVISMLLSAARAALFLSSLDDGEPELALTPAATVNALGRVSAAAGEVAAMAHAELEDALHRASEPAPAPVAALRGLVVDMSPYAAIPDSTPPLVAPL
jgi:hypothetical protein